MPVVPVTCGASNAISVAQSQLQVPATSASLPTLEHSDSAIGKAIESVIGKLAFVQWVVPHTLIVHIVSTVDNLPRQQAPVLGWPVKPVLGSLQVSGRGATLAIAQGNAARYAPHLQILQNLGAQRLVSVYLEFYPLFQKAYKEFGYPSGNFNARLLVVIDNLLAAPEPQAPILLAQPRVLDTYADATLESASAGQKILMRMGLRNEQAVKSWPRQIKAQLLQHLQATPASSPRTEP
ncbi:MAG: DUF3014 domain-containing protein [Proteobacteria bacterium]|nr:DUF3014 domain-containing protein [Pseudomonadota bacterium]